MPESFSSKLEKAFSTKGQLCVGIDPHSELIIEAGLDDTVAGLETFSFKLLDEVSEVAGIIKPQVSFFERFGSRGFQVLENLLIEANRRGLLVIADAKRGDIGSTMQAYTDAWLSKDAPFICDALTLSPYLGFGTLNSAIAAAAERGKGVFILCATSNPEGVQVQQASVGEGTVALDVATQAAKYNSVTATSRSRFGNVGLVIGATVELSSFGLTLNNGVSEHRAPILSPGFGTQGASLSDVRKLFGENASDVICNVSRSALRNGLINARAAVVQDQQILARALAG